MNILKFFTKNEIEVVNIIRDLCKKRSIKVYIVGGAVRDAILGSKIKDIDICIDSNPNVIISELQHLKHCRYYQEFQTASLTFESGITIDLIRCRKEYYKKDGELPIIKPSHIYDDLYRRDFTINSLAYDIVKNDIIDIYGGIEDIKNKIIRKIHLNSYREDPTRIFRAVKYGVRYGFNLKDRDEIEQCIKENIFNIISKDRITKEIYSLCCEVNWVKTICLCNELKIFNIDGQALKIKYPAYMESLIYSFKNIDIRILRLFYALRDDTYINILVENSILNKKLKSTIKYFAEKLQKIIDFTACTLDNYELYSLLNNMNDYQLIFLSWNNKLKYKIYNYISNMSNYKLSLNGNDVKALGIKEGKCIKKILNYIMKVELNTALKWEEEYLLKDMGEIYK
ncbi:CCA tRNA nucleotidyltransferase [Clostridium sp. WILCCON 0269]|uniref:CCA tRNA nucleotidyltransferase n=1 Tax=Candidatus Clostridium eludens TaxID=3381663 RepID=A0ABW8SL76_9CLOT